MIEDAQIASSNARTILSATLNNLSLLNKIMMKVQNDAAKGIVAYDDQGNPIMDLDLVENKVIESEE